MRLHRVTTPFKVISIAALTLTIPFGVNYPILKISQKKNSKPQGKNNKTESLKSVIIKLLNYHLPPFIRFWFL